MLLFNSVMGLGLFVGTLFLDSAWGSGASFQAVFTALVHLLYCVGLLYLVNDQNIRHADFLGGIMVMMNVLLLETAALWGDLAGGLSSSVFPEGQLCVFTSGSSEKFVTVLSTIIFLVHIILSGLIILWKDDLLHANSYRSYGMPTDFNNGGNKPGAAGSVNGHHGHMDTDGYHASNSNSIHVPAANSAQHEFVIDDDDDDGDAEL